MVADIAAGAPNIVAIVADIVAYPVALVAASPHRRHDMVTIIVTMVADIVAAIADMNTDIVSEVFLGLLRS